MGRPKRQTADYFPHYVGGSRRTIFVLESKWGNDGYAFWFKLLELLCMSDGHYYDCSKRDNMEYLIALSKTDGDRVAEILELLAGLGKIDRELWEKRKVIWCPTLVENLQGLYAKRTVSIPERPSLDEFPERELTESGINVENKGETTGPEEAQESKEVKKRTRKKKKEDGPEKKNYAEFVRMTEAEYQKLIEGYGEEKTKRMIQVLDNYKGSKGKTYTSDYRAILSWVADRVNEEIERKGGNAHGWAADRQPEDGGFRPSGGFRQ